MVPPLLTTPLRNLATACASPSASAGA